MLDPWAIKTVNRPLKAFAHLLKKKDIKPDQVTIAGFALADPGKNAICAVFLILSFVGTGTSFLAFAVMAQKHNLKSLAYPHKSMYYIGGLTEGTETILFFIIICIFPGHFPVLAFFFAGLCAVTTITRLSAGYTTLKDVAKNKEKMVFNQGMNNADNP